MHRVLGVWLLLYILVSFMRKMVKPVYKGEIRCACVQSLSNKHIYKALDHVPLLEKCVSIIREL